MTLYILIFRLHRATDDFFIVKHREKIKQWLNNLLIIHHSVISRVSKGINVPSIRERKTFNIIYGSQGYAITADIIIVTKELITLTLVSKQNHIKIYCYTDMHIHSTTIIGYMYLNFGIAQGRSYI